MIWKSLTETMILICKQSFSMLLLTFRPWWLTWPLVPISLRSDFSNGDGQTILSTGHVDCIRWINVDSGQFHMDMSSLIIGFVDAADTYSPCRQWLTGEIWGSSETPKSRLGFCLYLLDSLSKTNLLNLFAGRDMDTSYPVTVLRCQQRFASVGGTLL